MKKNKVAPPFRKAEFPIFYDGRPMDKVDELANVALLKGLIPKYDSQGNLSPTGRTYKWANEPLFYAKKKDEVAPELKKYPKMQEELIEILKNGVEDPEVFESHNFDSEMSEEEFEQQMQEDIKNLENNSEAEEVEGSWEDM